MQITAQIDGLSGRAHVLSALYGASQPLGMGMLHFVPGGLAEADAMRMMEEQGGSFDYLMGRVMKVNLAGPARLDPQGRAWMEFDAWGYDRDNGEGAALAALARAGIPAFEWDPKNAEL